MLSETSRTRVADNWRQAVAAVAAAATAAGRSSDEVRIIGVSKYVDTETTAALIAAGCRDLGEARPQQLLAKSAEQLSDTAVRWHLIGPLQRNKARRLLPVVDTIHSVDSLKLLRYLDTVASEEQARVRVLLEVNISGDATKHGFTRATLSAAAERGLTTSAVEVVGLMGMAGLHSDADEARRQFASLRSLRDETAAATGLRLPELSMGMSGDFVAAIAEGATQVRIGSRLFEGLLPNE